MEAMWRQAEALATKDELADARPIAVATAAAAAAAIVKLADGRVSILLVLLLLSAAVAADAAALHCGGSAAHPTSPH